MAPGRFSATINQAGDNRMPNLLGWSAPWLLRNVFETCKTYKQALSELKNAVTVCPVYVQLVGCNKDEACVIEINPTGDNAVYKYNGKPLGLTNHSIGDKEYEDSEFVEKGVTYVTDSKSRLLCIERRASKCLAKTISGVMPILKKSPVFDKDDTHQSMVFCAKTGEIAVSSQ
jgi:hypothetical protein